MDSAHGNQKVSDSQIIEAAAKTEGPFFTAGEVADELPVTRTGLSNRLKNLQEEGRVDRKKRGNWVGWWLTEDYSDSR